MPVFTDQTGRSISLQSVPRRIISIVPSQTELLYHLGLGEDVTGITKFCVHPGEWFRTKTRVGGTKTLSLDTIHKLQPDLIIANKEENVKEQVEALEKHYPVWVSHVNNLNDACTMISSIGDMLERTAQAQDMIKHIRTAFQQLNTDGPPLRTAYLIWRDPYMSIGGDTFIHDMLARCGLENIFADQLRYPVVAVPQLRASDCQLLLLSSEPYPFKQKHVDELQQELPGARIMLADGEMFSWYGSRLLKAAAYFQQMLKEVKGQK